MKTAITFFALVLVSVAAVAEVRYASFIRQDTQGFDAKLKAIGFQVQPGSLVLSDNARSAMLHAFGGAPGFNENFRPYKLSFNALSGNAVLQLNCDATIITQDGIDRFEIGRCSATMNNCRTNIGKLERCLINEL